MMTDRRLNRIEGYPSALRACKPPDIAQQKTPNPLQSREWVTGIRTLLARFLSDAQLTMAQAVVSQRGHHRLSEHRALTAPHSVKTRATVDRLGAAGNEWNGRFLSTTGARHLVIYSLTPNWRSMSNTMTLCRGTHLSLARFATRWATHRLIGEAFGSVKLLLSRCENEIHPTIPTGKGLVCEAHGSLLL